MTIQKALEQGTHILTVQGQVDAKLDARVLLEEVLGCDRTYLILNPNQHLTEAQYNMYDTYITNRAKGIPLQHILGYQEFMGLDFIVSPDTLIPRKETEELVELALNLISEKSHGLILDLGTGTGCIPISLAVMHKGINAIGVDVSEKALNIAKENAYKHEVNNRINWVLSDLFSAVESYKGKIDMIISNPPYIKTSDIEHLMIEVRDHEPHLALNGGQDGLDFYRRICNGAEHFLKENGFILFEIGHDQADDVMELLKQKAFKDIICKKDLSGINRIIYAKKRGFN